MSRIDAPYTTTLLALETRNKIQIQNEYYSNPNNSIIANLRSEAERCRKKYGKDILFRVELCAGYNCHGLTFASRRTTIWLAEEVRKILEHDGYKKIKPSELMPGDVIVYEKDGDMEHSGVIVGTYQDGRPPLVLSKWGQGPELLHPANICPYNYSGAEYYRVKE